uniref:Uncharacterized protein n=1 Tax=Solanum tuberosum TaxID=4113 RepID=M1DM85_SOLTU
MYRSLWDSTPIHILGFILLNDSLHLELDECRVRFLKRSSFGSSLDSTILLACDHGATRGGEAACLQVFPKRGPSPRATGRLVKATAGCGRGRGLKLSLRGLRVESEATGQGTTGTMKGRVTLDGPWCLM